MENPFQSTKDTLLITLSALICLLPTVHMYLRWAPLLATLHKEKERHSSHPTSSIQKDQIGPQDHVSGTMLGI